MPALPPFTPGNSVTITVIGTSATVALPKPGDQVRIASAAGNAVAYIAFVPLQTSTVVAPTGTPANGVPILPGTIETFTVPPSALYIATIGTAANTLYVTCGDGE